MLTCNLFCINSKSTVGIYRYILYSFSALAPRFFCTLQLLILRSFNAEIKARLFTKPRPCRVVKTSCLHQRRAFPLYIATFMNPPIKPFPLSIKSHTDNCSRDNAESWQSPDSTSSAPQQSARSRIRDPLYRTKHPVRFNINGTAFCGASFRCARQKVRALDWWRILRMSLFNSFCPAKMGQDQVGSVRKA